MGMLLRVSCNFVADGAKNGLQGEDLLEVEPLVCRGRGLVFSLVLLWHAELSYRRIDEVEAKNAP